MQIHGLSKKAVHFYPRRVTKVFPQDAHPNVYENFGRWLAAREVTDIHVVVDPRMWNEYVKRHLVGTRFSHVAIYPVRCMFIDQPVWIPECSTHTSGFFAPCPGTMVSDSVVPGCVYFRNYSQDVPALPHISPETHIHEIICYGNFKELQRIPSSLPGFIDLTRCYVSNDDFAHISTFSNVRLIGCRYDATCQLQAFACKKAELSVNALGFIDDLTQCTELLLVVPGTLFPVTKSFPTMKGRVVVEGYVVEYSRVTMLIYLLFPHAIIDFSRLELVTSLL